MQQRVWNTSLVSDLQRGRLNGEEETDVCLVWVTWTFLCGEIGQTTLRDTVFNVQDKGYQ